MLQVMASLWVKSHCWLSKCSKNPWIWWSYKTIFRSFKRV